MNSFRINEKNHRVRSTTMRTPPFYSVVIPVYNEADNIYPLTDELVAVLQKLQGGWEIIFVDDGSIDTSLQIMKDVSHRWPNIRILGLNTNKGQSAAFDAGFSKARGDVIITMDADMQNDPRDIPTLIEKIGDYDLACGWRKKRNDTLIRRFSSRIANAVRNSMSGETIRDVGCSLKVFRKKYVRNIKLYNGMHRFFPTLIKMEGGRVIEIAVNHRPRKHGTSKYGIGNRIVRSFIDLLAVCWMKNRYIHYDIKEYTL